MAQPETATRTERLLVVEDDAFSQELIALYLRKAGFTDIVAATDGRQALDLAKASSFDLILLDLNLPRISGVDVLRRLTKEGHVADTPVVVISSLTNMEETVLCLDLGAEDYLPKPFNVRLLEGRVNGCLERRRLRREAEAASARGERDHETAQALLQDMAAPALPSPGPAFPCEGAARRDPAPAVGGDLAELFAAGDGAVGFLIGTAGGQGVSAALLAARVRTLVRREVERAAAAGTAPEPGAVLQRVNAALCGPAASSPAGATAAIAFGLLTPADGALRIANAGFADALVLSPARGVVPVTTPRGRPLGAYAEAVYTAHAAELKPGETLVALTDGFADATDAAGVPYGENRVKRLLDDLLSAPPEALAAALSETVTGFASGAAQRKDRSVIALRRTAG
ncbi:SpoIIE family protein phosphatase [Azospirillum sp. SYSU D00513]|uniref:PP2C family protein-serine/threonine phosphatase n=1 Tax=Azospirillum sp. SYSU D00513 TaxID=2812561 RepID=UPI001A96E387|nr:SpoIIE family protein phosphatase [Azospirillum sp. SYSU D00513]